MTKFQSISGSSLQQQLNSGFNVLDRNIEDIEEIVKSDEEIDWRNIYDCKMSYIISHFYNGIKNHFSDEDNTPWWIVFGKKMSENDQDAMYVNSIRKCVLSFVYKFVDQLKECGESERNKLFKELGERRLGTMLNLFVPLDKGNALYNMKCEWNDPQCPNGFIWATAAEFEKLKADRKNVMGHWTQNSHSINKRLVYLHENYGLIHNEFLETEFPPWVAVIRSFQLI